MKKREGETTESRDGHKLPRMEAEMIVIITIKRSILSLSLSHMSMQEKGMFKWMCHQCLRLTWVGQVYTGKG